MLNVVFVLGRKNGNVLFGLSHFCSIKAPIYLIGLYTFCIHLKMASCLKELFKSALLMIFVFTYVFICTILWFIPPKNSAFLCTINTFYASQISLLTNLFWVLLMRMPLMPLTQLISDNKVVYFGRLKHA